MKKTTDGPVRSSAFRRSSLVLVLALGVVTAAETKVGPLSVSIEKGGCGLLDSVRFKGRDVIKAKPGFVGGSVTLVPAGDGTLDSLFANKTSVVLPAVIDSALGGATSLAAMGKYTDGKIQIPFGIQINMAQEAFENRLGDTVQVQVGADFTQLDPRYIVAEWSLRLPLVITDDPHLRMFAFGAAHRAEMFRMDMNDINRGGQQLISAPRGHWPYWDIGGVLQLPASYRIWKANHADTMAYPLDEGEGAPGWADYSELDWGVTAVVEKPKESAPWAIAIDARKGVLTLSPHPGSQLPASGKALGRPHFTFQLVFHETSWPATWPCELDFKLYEALLKDMSTGSGGKPSPWVLYGPVGTADIPTIIHRERIQPSVMLRTLYRGDAWQMQGRMRSIGKEVPRNQPMEKWEKDAKEYLDFIRKNGLPKPK